jgi:hypothetical protein
MGRARAAGEADAIAEKKLSHLGKGCKSLVPYFWLVRILS